MVGVLLDGLTSKLVFLYQRTHKEVGGQKVAAPPMFASGSVWPPLLLRVYASQLCNSGRHHR